jgi:D-lactate dehydrogenase
VREGNFSLEGLVGFDLHGKTVGVIGTGKIGSVFAKSMLAVGAKVLAYDLQQNSELAAAGVHYTELSELLQSSDIVSLHVPLNTATRHMINSDTLALTKPGVMLINTVRGELIDTRALIQYLKSGHIGSAGLDVYEEEGVFFSDHSGEILQDDQLARLMTFPNVLITSHQAFLTHEALQNIATTTLQSITDFEAGRELRYAL